MGKERIVYSPREEHFDGICYVVDKKLLQAFREVFSQWRLAAFYTWIVKRKRSYAAISSARQRWIILLEVKMRRLFCRHVWEYEIIEPRIYKICHKCGGRFIV